MIRVVDANSDLYPLRAIVKLKLSEKHLASMPRRQNIDIPRPNFLDWIKWHTEARMSSIPYILITLGANNLYVTASRKYLLKMEIFKILTTCILKNKQMPAYIKYSIAKISSSKRHRKKILDKQLQLLSSEITTTRDVNITSQPASLCLWPGCCPILWNSGTWPLSWGRVLVRWWGVGYPLSILPRAWISCLRLEPEKLLKKGKVKHLSRSKIKVGSFVSLLSSNFLDFFFQFSNDTIGLIRYSMQLQVYELRGECIRTQTKKKTQQYTFEIRHLASKLCLMIFQDYLNL